MRVLTDYALALGWGIIGAVTMAVSLVLGDKSGRPVILGD